MALRFRTKIGIAVTSGALIMVAGGVSGAHTHTLTSRTPAGETAALVQAENWTQDQITSGKNSTLVQDISLYTSIPVADVEITSKFTASAVANDLLDGVTNSAAPNQEAYNALQKLLRDHGLGRAESIDSANTDLSKKYFMGAVAGLFGGLLGGIFAVKTIGDGEARKVRKDKAEAGN